MVGLAFTVLQTANVEAQGDPHAAGDNLNKRGTRVGGDRLDLGHRRGGKARDQRKERRDEFRIEENGNILKKDDLRDSKQESIEDLLERRQERRTGGEESRSISSVN